MLCKVIPELIFQSRGKAYNSNNLSKQRLKKNTLGACGRGFTPNYDSDFLRHHKIHLQKNISVTKITSLSYSYSI